MSTRSITADDFRRMTGRAPEQDDLERANCPHAGEALHNLCGICPEHNKPRFECGWPCRKETHS